MAVKVIAPRRQRAARKDAHAYTPTAFQQIVFQSLAIGGTRRDLELCGQMRTESPASALFADAS